MSNFYSPTVVSVYKFDASYSRHALSEYKLETTHWTVNQYCSVILDARVPVQSVNRCKNITWNGTELGHTHRHWFDRYRRLASQY